MSNSACSSATVTGVAHPMDDVSFWCMLVAAVVIVIVFALGLGYILLRSHSVATVITRLPRPFDEQEVVHLLYALPIAVLMYLANTDQVDFQAFVQRHPILTGSHVLVGSSDSA